MTLEGWGGAGLYGIKEHPVLLFDLALFLYKLICQFPQHSGGI